MDREDERDDCVHRDKLKYYRIKQDILKEGAQEVPGRGVIDKGRHIFPFSFKIPSRSVNMEALGIALGTEKVSMDVQTRQTGYKQGEVLRVRVEIENLSSRSVKPRFVLDENSFFGSNRGKIQKHEILKEKADAVDSYSGKTIMIKEIIIPRELPPSILNCSIIKLEYRLKVYLEITCEADLVVKLPIVIIPEQTEENASSCSRFVAFGSLNQPAWMSQSTDPPPSYEESAIYPSFHFGN